LSFDFLECDPSIVASDFAAKSYVRFDSIPFAAHIGNCIFETSETPSNKDKMIHGTAGRTDAILVFR
jgi:hypothetical protein